MYYKKNIKTYTPQSYSYNLSDFSRGVNKEIDENLLNINYANIAYNVNLDNKSLRNGHGVKEFVAYDPYFDYQEYSYQLPEGTKPLGLWSFKVANEDGEIEDIILLYCDNKKLYFSYLCDIADFFLETGITLEAKPVILTYVYNGLETAVICSPQDPMYIWNGTPQPVNSEKAIHLSSMCSHYERLFASSSDKKNVIRFSQDFDITNWEETSEAGGFIQLVDERGDISKVLSFNDYVYIIREFGISRLSAYGDQSEFNITHINLSSNRIFGNTAVLCGDRIVVLTNNGLHYCTGGSLYKYDFKINSLINKDMMEYACACYFNGKYYLATRIDFEDDKQVGCEQEEGYQNNVLIEFDLETQKINITRGIDICNLCVMRYENMQKLTFIMHGTNSNMIGELTDNGELFSSNLLKTWQSPQSDLGTQKTKVVKSISLLTKNKVTIIVRSEKEEQTIVVMPYDKTQKILCNVVGDRIGVEFTTTEGALHISNPTINVELLEE